MTTSTAYAPDALASLRDSFALHLRLRSAKTRVIYLAALDSLIAHLEAEGMPTGARGVRREHIESFLAKRRDDGVKMTTLSVEFRALQQFWRWAVDEDEIEVSPMAKIKPPVIPRTPVPIVTEDDFRKLLKVTEGKGFNDRRDHAILRLMYDTGSRRGEIMGLHVDDVDLAKGTIFVTGKAQHSRVVRFGQKAGIALDRYMRLRRGHRHADRPELWLGQDGPLSGSGLAQLLARRCRAAGLPRLHPHQLRHTYAHVFLSEGGLEGNLVHNMGWKSRAMVDRYGSSAAAERARAAYKSPGDKL